MPREFMVWPFWSVHKKANLPGKGHLNRLKRQNGFKLASHQASQQISGFQVFLGFEKKI